MEWLRKNKHLEIFQRKNIIIIYIVIISILITSILGLVVNVLLEKNENDKSSYKETGKIDYKVYLKENDFFKDEYLDKNNQYIASIIKNIKADFDYELDLFEKDKNYKYTYRIEAVTAVKDKDTHNTLYQETEELLAEKEQEFKSSEKLTISEKIDIKYSKYNDLISKFVDIYDLDNSESTVSINMYVDILDDKYKEIHNEPVISLNIPLTKKTVAIDISSNVVDEEKSKNEFQVINKEKIFAITVLFIISITLGIKLYLYIFDTQNEKTIYKMKLRKIISNYGSYIQEINKDFDFEGYQTIELNTFENLVRIRDIVQEPILMLQRKEETHFMVPTQTKLIYMFELNQGTTKKRIAEKSEETTSQEQETINV